MDTFTQQKKKKSKTEETHQFHALWWKNYSSNLTENISLKDQRQRVFPLLPLSYTQCFPKRIFKWKCHHPPKPNCCTRCLFTQQMQVYVDGKFVPPTGKDLKRHGKKSGLVHSLWTRNQVLSCNSFSFRASCVVRKSERSVVWQRGKYKNPYLRLLPPFPRQHPRSTDLYFPVRTCRALIPHRWAPPTSFTISSPIMMACQSNEIQKHWRQVNSTSAIRHAPLT